MKKLSLILLALNILANSASLRAQAFVHEQSKASGYEWPTDPDIHLDELLAEVRTAHPGLIEEDAARRLREVGEWLGRRGKAIYSTRITPHYNEGNIWFTANKDGKTLYAVYALPEGEDLPATLEWTGNIPQGAVTILNNGKRAGCSVKDSKVSISLKGNLKNEPVALAFQISK